MNQKIGHQTGVRTQTGNKKVRKLSETVSNRHLHDSSGLGWRWGVLRRTSLQSRFGRSRVCSTLITAGTEDTAGMLDLVFRDLKKGAVFPHLAWSSTDSRWAFIGCVHADEAATNDQLGSLSA